jgi:hypothetical protein
LNRWEQDRPRFGRGRQANVSGRRDGTGCFDGDMSFEWNFDGGLIDDEETYVTSNKYLGAQARFERKISPSQLSGNSSYPKTQKITV